MTEGTLGGAAETRTGEMAEKQIASARDALWTTKAAHARRRSTKPLLVLRGLGEQAPPPSVETLAEAEAWIMARPADDAERWLMANAAVSRDAAF